MDDRSTSHFTSLDRIEALIRAWRKQHTEGAVEVEMPAKWVLDQIVMVADQARCVCGEPRALGTAHRNDGPCFVEQRPAQAGHLTEARGLLKRSLNMLECANMPECDDEDETMPRDEWCRWCNYSEHVVEFLDRSAESPHG